MKSIVPHDLRSKLTARLAKGRSGKSGFSDRVVVLLYHSIHPRKPFASASPEVFEEHLQWLKEHCDLIPFGTALAEASRGGRIRPAVAITFDDGYADNHEYALPALSRLGIPATFFLTTGLLDRDPFVVERIRKLQQGSADEVEGLTWSQVLEMRDEGMEFGGHTRAHPNLAAADHRTAFLEMSSCKQVIEEHLGQPVRAFAYPFGKPKHHFTATTIRLAARCGYDAAAAVRFRRVRPSDQALAIPRFSVSNDGLEMLEAKVLGRLDLIGLWQERAPRWLSRLVSPETSVAG